MRIGNPLLPTLVDRVRESSLALRSIERASATPERKPILSTPKIDQVKSETPIGDRRFATTNLANKSAIEKLSLEGAAFSDSTASVVTESGQRPTDTRSQEQVQKFRDAITRVVEVEAIQNPNLTVEELSSELDRVFGDGTTELFTISRVDEGFGKTSIRIDQKEFKDLTEEQKTIFNNAVDQADEKFNSTRGASSDSSRFDDNPLFDDLRVAYQSGRFGEAFTASQISRRLEQLKQES